MHGDMISGNGFPCILCMLKSMSGSVAYALLRGGCRIFMQREGLIAPFASG